MLTPIVSQRHGFVEFWGWLNLGTWKYYSKKKKTIKPSQHHPAIHLVGNRVQECVQGSHALSQGLLNVPGCLGLSWNIKSLCGRKGTQLPPQTVKVGLSLALASWVSHFPLSLSKVLSSSLT